MRTLPGLVHLLERDAIAHIILRAGDAWMVVAPSLAARVIGAGVGNDNLLWTAGRFSTRGWADGGNAGGARTWIAPEGGPRGFFFGPDGASWDVPPEIDPGAYTPCPVDDGWLSFRNELTVRAADGARFPIAITRSLKLEPLEAGNGLAAGGRILVRQELCNLGTTTLDRHVGLWYIAQVPSEKPGTIMIPVREGAAPGCVNPYFSSDLSGVLRQRGSVIIARALGGRKWKLGVPAAVAAGGISFIREGLPGSRTARAGGIDNWTVVSLHFTVDPGGTYLDMASDGRSMPSNGDAVQAYNDAGTDEAAFSEIEAHAPAVRLEPGERQAFDIEMTIASGTLAGVIDFPGRTSAPGLTPSDLSW